MMRKHFVISTGKLAADNANRDETGHGR